MTLISQQFSLSFIWLSSEFSNERLVSKILCSYFRLVHAKRKYEVRDSGRGPLEWEQQLVIHNSDEKVFLLCFYTYPKNAISLLSIDLVNRPVFNWVP